MPDTINKRNQLLDAVKGIAIILVVLGHSVQFCSGLNNFDALSLPISRFIISFHMPLFMIVSGYLFYGTLRRHDMKDIIKKRLKMLAIPIVAVAAIHHFRYHLHNFNLFTFIKDIPNSFFNSLWFFWALLLITLLVCFVKKYLRDSWLGYVAIIALTLFLPDNYPLRAYLFMLPTFVFAYKYAEWQHKYNYSRGGYHSVTWVF